MTRKHLVFDCDGTLIDSEGPIIKALGELLLEEKGLEVPYEVLTKAMGHPGRSTMVYYGFEDPNKAMAMWNEKIAKYSFNADFFEGIEELLTELKNRGYSIGIITSRVRDEYDFAAENLHFERFVKVSVTADETANPKPFPDPMLKYFEKASTTKDDVVYIGDTMSDYNCAIGADVPFILAGWGSRFTEDGMHIALKPADVLKIIEEM